MSSGHYEFELTPGEKALQSDGSVQKQEKKKASVRNLVAFWLFGLCNNFAYVIMLSAAHDILSDETKHEPNATYNISTVTPQNFTVSGNETQDQRFLHCNAIGTGAILLADILPTLLVKLSAPFYIDRVGYRLKVSLVVIFSISSFIIVAFSEVVWLSIVGVVCASLGAGLGEPTFLGLSTYFNRNVVSTWSSGTGGAGVFGALSYAGLTSAGVSPRNTLLIMIIIPVILALSYFFLLSSPSNQSPSTKSEEANKVSDVTEIITWRDKIHLAKPLLKFMVPLMAVYLAEYFINQGLVDYQLGVFISRSSVNLLRINRLWLLPILQLANMAILQTQVVFQYFPSVWVIFGVILFEGLLGGAAYVNTFYKMSRDIEPEYREYSLSVATTADSVGIAIAGAIAIPVHNALCQMNILIS